jgi:hypothetical protein
MIGDLNCSEQIFRIGKVTFYDARVWDFGEGYLFDSGYHPAIDMGEELKGEFSRYDSQFSDGKTLRRNSARAFVDIKSRDSYSAIDEAKILVNKALDILVFSSSAYKTDYGFKPQLPSYHYVVDEQGNANFSIRSDVHSEMLQVNEVMDIISNFNRLLSQNDNKFKIQLLRALTWYRKGLWEETPHAKFLSYWVALEQLIVTAGGKIREKKLEPLTKYIPKLSVSWKELPSTYSIRVRLGQVIAALKNDHELSRRLSLHPLLRDWQATPAVILENLTQFRKINTNRTILSLIVDLEDNTTGRGKQRIINELNSAQQSKKFLVTLLNHKRNTLAHEGKIYSPDLPYFTELLRGILVHVMEVLFQLGHKGTLDSIVAEYNRPFNRPDKKMRGYNNLESYLVSR